VSSYPTTATNEVPRERTAFHERGQSSESVQARQVSGHRTPLPAPNQSADSNETASLIMDATHRPRLTRQSAVAKSSLTRTQSFIDLGERKLNDIQVRFDELLKIYNKFETAQCELELSDDTDYSLERQQFEDRYFEVKAKINEPLHPVVELPTIQTQLTKKQLVWK